jgi:thioredoxin reductase (NADPH)
VSTFSVAVIGAGPVGLFAASACAERGLDVLVLDALPQVGGQCSALYPDKTLNGVPGFLGVSAQGFIDVLLRQARYSDLVLNATVDSVLGDGPFEIHTKDNVFVAQKIILSTGGGHLSPNKLIAEGIEDFDKTHVHYCVTTPRVFAGKNVVIAGGGNSAVDWAIELAQTAKSVTLVHRRSVFRAHNEIPLMNQEAEGNICIYRDSQIAKFIGESGVLQQVRIKKIHSDDSSVISQAADDVIVFFGLAASTENRWGVDMSNQKILVNTTTYETSRPGIYAVGDAIWRANGIYMILPGVAEALTVATVLKAVG